VTHRIARDQIVWPFGPELEPVLQVEPGESTPKIDACPAPFAV
jgi:hypothetical protein